MIIVAFVVATAMILTFATVFDDASGVPDIIVCVEFSRVFLGMRHPSDILAGWCLGVAWAAVPWPAFALWDSRPGGVRGPR